MTDEAAAALAALRREIDGIDEGLHRLLMERGRIIDRLIAAKGTAASGSAFRPEREAAMMRVLAGRHEGHLPFDAVESIWRVIISTFTHVQAPYSIHADIAAGDAPMRDSTRFHFGFTTPLLIQPDAGAVIAAVAGSRGDLGLLAPSTAAGPWWQALEDPAAPKVIARLPFTERAGHPAGLPLLVLSRVISGEGFGATRLYGASGLDLRDLAERSPAVRVVASEGASALLAAPASLHPDEIAAGAGGARLVPVGSHPDPVPVRP